MWLPRRSCRGPLTAGVGGAMPARPQPPPLAPQKSPLVVVAPLVTEEMSLPHPHGPGGLLPQWLEFSEDEYFLESGQGAGGLPGCLEESPPTPARAEGIGSRSFSPPGVPGPPQLPRPGLCLSLSLCRDGRSGRLCCAPDFRALRKITTLTRFCSFNLVSVALLSAFVKFCILILFVVVSSFLFLFFFFGYKAIRVRED